MVSFSFSDVGINLPTFQVIEEIENVEDLKAVAKFKHYESGWIWYVIAGEPVNDDVLLYCYVRGDFNEFGHILLSSLLNVGAMFCLTFTSCYIEEVMD